MSISAGNLDQLLNLTGAVEELYSVTVKSLTTATGHPTVVSAAAVVVNGNGAPGTEPDTGEQFKVATVNDQTDVTTLAVGYPTSLVDQLDNATVIGFANDALLLYTDGTGSLLAGANPISLNGADFAVFSPAPLATGTVLTFTATGVFDGSLYPPPVPTATQATVTGADGAILLLNFDDAALASQAQGQLNQISNAIAAGTTYAEAGATGSYAQIPSSEGALADVEAAGYDELPQYYTSAVDVASGPVSLIAAAAGNQLIVDGGSGDLTYAAVAGVETVYAGAGNTLVFGGGASLDFFGGLGDATVIGGNGGNAVTGGDGAQLVFGDSTLDYVGGVGAATLIGGTGGNTVTGGAGRLLVFASSTLTYSGSGGAATVIGGSGPLNAALGTGGGTAYGGPGGDNLLSTASSSQSILVGGGSGDVIGATGSGNDVLVAASGAETINATAATGNLVIFGGSGPDVLAGGTGNDLFVTEGGNETLTGGGGIDSYVFIDFGATSRTDVITDFDANKDAIGLFGYGGEPAADKAALASAANVGGNTVLNLTDGTQIVLLGGPTLHGYNFF